MRKELVVANHRI